MDDPNINAYEDSFKPKLTLLEWLNERYENCLRIADSTKGEDRDGWLEDAEYVKRAIEVCAEAQQANHLTAAVNARLDAVEKLAQAVEYSRNIRDDEVVVALAAYRKEHPKP